MSLSCHVCSLKRRRGCADIGLTTVRLDYWQGHETLSWLEEGHRKAGVKPLTQADEVAKISEYLDGSLVSAINEVC